MGKHRKSERPATGDLKPTIKSDGNQKRSTNGQKSQSNGQVGRKDGSALLIEPRPDWHAVDLPAIPFPASASTPSPKFLHNVKEFAHSLLDSQAKAYASTRRQASSAHKFMTTVMDTGTWSDKISALTLVVQESPIHTQKELENLLKMAGKRSRDNALMALAAVKDLLGQGMLLPADRKLRYFTSQPALIAAAVGVKPSWTSDEPLPKGLSRRHLLVWAYEDWLKQSYFEMLQVLETWCNDTVENSRMRAVTYVFELLKDKPEQEENLLRLLVNNLGDTSRKIASRASHLLLQLQTFHPQMQGIVVQAIQTEVLLKPGQSSIAKYYAAITLNQTVLSAKDSTTPSRLLDVYFGVFVSILNKSKNQLKEADKNAKKRKRGGPKLPAEADIAEVELDDKIVGQVLIGIHRAFPYCKSESAKFEEHIDTMFRITHSANFSTSIQALQLIQQISSSLSISIDRYMRTLYESLLDPRLLNSSKQTLYLNLLYRSLKTDASMRRVKAFIKRLTQVMALHEPPFICASLYLIHELETTFPGLKTMFNQPEIQDDDDEEVFHDVPDSDDERDAILKGLEADKPSVPRKDIYDPRKRDPEHSNAEKACLWELPPWALHYHPSTTLFAQSLLSPSTKTVKRGRGSHEVPAFPPKPDPASHTLMHFLDRFAYRNPKVPADSKAGSTTRGTSLMQPALASTGATDTLFTSSRHSDTLPFPSSTSTPGSGGAMPIANTEAFWSRQASQVPANEVFFHRYFSDIGPKRKAAAAKREGTTKKKRGPSDDEWDEEVGAGEDEIWKALVGSRPEIEDEADEDGDDSVDDDFAAEMDGGDEEADEGDEEVELNLESDDDFGDEDIELDDGQSDDDGEDDDDGGLVLDDEDAMFSDESLDEEVGDEPPAKKAKGDKDAKSDKSNKDKKKKRLTSLPTFASVDDYARMIDEAEGQDGLDDG